MAKGPFIVEQGNNLTTFLSKHPPATGTAGPVDIANARHGHEEAVEVAAAGRLPQLAARSKPGGGPETVPRFRL